MGTDVDVDDFTISSSNPDVEAVRASIVDMPAEAAPEPEAEASASAGLDDAEATAGDSSVETPEPQERDERGKFKGRKASLQERLAHTTWEREEARRQNAALQAQIEQLRRTPMPQDAPAEPEGAPPGKPRLQDYDDHDKYVDDTVQWHLSEERRRAEVAAAFREDVSRRSSYADREQQYAATVPDYHDVMARVATVPISATLQQAILSSERGPAVAYFLATHPEVATGLIAQTERLPVEAAPLVRQLLESHLPALPASTGSGSGIRERAVPPPISPVGASPVATDGTADNDLSTDQWIERENAREAAARKKARNLR